MKLKGVLPALVTPFDKNGKIDFNAFEKLLEYLRKAGVSGWVPNGSTGEYNTMTAEERVSVLKFVADFSNDGEILVAGTNAGSTWEVIEHTNRAGTLGYQNVLLSAPFYAQPAQDELIKHFQAVLDATEVNIILYNYPPKVGVEIGFSILDAFADSDRVIAIKESSGVLQRAIEIYERYQGKIALCNGSDDIALDFMVWGAESWICGPANCMAVACVDLFNTYERGDLKRARAKMTTLYRVMNSLETGKFIQKVKYGAELIGCPVGDCRPPLQPLNDKEKIDFKTSMEPIINWQV